MGARGGDDQRLTSSALSPVGAIIDRQQRALGTASSGRRGDRWRPLSNNDVIEWIVNVFGEQERFHHSRLAALKRGATSDPPTQRRLEVLSFVLYDDQHPQPALLRELQDAAGLAATPGRYVAPDLADHIGPAGRRVLDALIEHMGRQEETTQAALREKQRAEDALDEVLKQRGENPEQ